MLKLFEIEKPFELQKKGMEKFVMDRFRSTVDYIPTRNTTTFFIF